MALSCYDEQLSLRFEGFQQIFNQKQISYGKVNTILLLVIVETREVIAIQLSSSIVNAKSLEGMVNLMISIMAKLPRPRRTPLQNLSIRRFHPTCIGKRWVMAKEIIYGKVPFDPRYPMIQKPTNSKLCDRGCDFKAVPNEGFQHTFH